MKVPKIFRVQYFFILAVGVTIGLVLATGYPEIPKRIAIILFPKPEAPPSPPTPSRPTLEQLNAVISGSLALIESQYTYYVHVTRNTQFAPNIRELGLGFGPENRDGTVMVLEVWQASDAVTKPSPLHGYLFKSLLVSMGPDKKDGFVIAAYPAENGNDAGEWPLYLSAVPDAKGGLFGMTSHGTWEIVDAAATEEIRVLLQRGKIAIGDLDKYSPENLPKSFPIANFKKDVQ